MSQPTRLPFLIGLTGGMGSGKSTVAKMLQQLGAEVIDADALSRVSTAAGGAAMAGIKAQFGSEFVDATGALDRQKMRELVFVDASAKARLEALIHPIVKQQMLERIAKTQAACVVLDLPLLLERSSFSSWLPKLHAVWVVDCSEATQIARVVERERERSKITPEAVQQVMSHQASRQQRRNAADILIVNEGKNLEALQQCVQQAFMRVFTDLPL